MTNRFPSILTKTLALLAGCVLVLTLVACNARSKYAGVYHCDSESRTTTSFFGQSQISGWGITDINLYDDGTLRLNGELQEDITWNVKDSEIVFTKGDQEKTMEISEDGTELYAGDVTFVKSR